MILNWRPQAGRRNPQSGIVGGQVFVWPGSGTTATVAVAAVGGYYDEKKKRKYVVKVGDKLMVFAKEADAVQALPQPEKKNIPAKKGQKAAQEKEALKPDVTVSLADIKRTADVLQKREAVDQLIEQRKYEALVKLYEDMVDEEEVEMLLMAA